jgi:hypothetical protein
MTALYSLFKPEMTGVVLINNWPLQKYDGAIKKD